MGLKQWIARLRGDEGLFKVAEKIAAQCLDASWNKIKPRAAQMPIAELRGYVRARTRLAVKNAIGRSEEAAALPNKRLTAAIMDEIARLSIARVLAAPEPVVVLRQAA